jgi:hypothetical protein
LRWIVNQTRAFFCRAAAQFNEITALHAAMKIMFHIESQWRGAPELSRGARSHE